MWDASQVVLTENLVALNTYIITIIKNPIFGLRTEEKQRLTEGKDEKKKNPWNRKQKNNENLIKCDSLKKNKIYQFKKIDKS